MFEDILGFPKDKDTPVPVDAIYLRVTANGKYVGADVDGLHIYVNYVDLTNSKTYNIKYHWPDAVSQKMFKKDDPMLIIFDDSDPTKQQLKQKCRRLCINTRKWDYIDLIEVQKR